MTGATTEVVRVLGYYDDSVVNLQYNALGTQNTLVSVSQTSMVVGSPPAVPTLGKDWRLNNSTQIVNYESNARIQSVFPDYSQRNANNEMNSYIAQWGVYSTATWSPAAQARYAEMNRCWNYVNAIRAANASMIAAALPADPTNDSHWPTRISPYVPLS
jgi:hypothetical protein